MSLEHWMTFATFSEQEFFTYPADTTYQGVVLNANMVAHAPAGIAAFLLEKVSPQTAFLIDPMTHAFQHNPKVIANAEGAPKSSIRNLAGEYGAVVSRNLGARPVVSREIIDEVDHFCESVLNFQWEYLAHHFESSDSAKYLEGEAVRRPSILVSPYFYLTEDNIEAWAPVNRRCAEVCSNMRNRYSPGVRVYSAVVASRSFLQIPKLREAILRSVENVGLDGVLLWIDEFDEASASSLELTGFLELCGELRTRELEVLNLHGGYFSCLAGSPALGERLSAVSHGPEFGEARGVVPVGGGIPISRFYVPDLHVRMKFRDFLPTAINNGWLSSASSFYDHVCSCSECKSVIADDPERFQLYGESEVKSIRRRNGVVRIEFPVTEAKKRCLRHYLNSKSSEFEFVNFADRNEILGGLEQSHAKFSGSESAENIAHLLRWSRAFESVDSVRK